MTRSAGLLGVYAFGSVGRGQQDDLSDLDVLAVVRNGGGKIAEQLVTEYVPPSLRQLKLSISWYGEDRLREMFRNGELFAWHLHSETLPLYDPIGYLHGLGTPAAYHDAVTDTRSFQKILRGIPAQVSANECNAVYESGLIYVCLRNIAMAASWQLCKHPNFTRHSPFELSDMRGCPISREEFALTMACRMAGQRGNAPPLGVDAAFVLDAYSRLDPWIEELCDMLERK
jgi:predicted nucleotidyltransferase